MLSFNGSILIDFVCVRVCVPAEIFPLTELMSWNWGCLQYGTNI